MNNQFIIEKASKRAKKLRIGLFGPSGYGKTYSSLLMAYGICKDWEKICVIDTEHGSASLYSDLGQFMVINFNPPYSPKNYIKAIRTAENAGFEVIIIDSIAHEWAGKGGCLEIHDKLGGRFQDWSKVSPMHNAFIDAILASKAHVITCGRTKQEYALTTGDSGKMRVQKMGLKEITREGFEYELDIAFRLVNENHLVEVSKDRTRIFDGVDPFIITSETGETLAKWSSEGEKEIDIALRAVRGCTNLEQLGYLFSKKYNHLKDNADFVKAIKARKLYIEDLNNGEKKEENTSN